MNLNIINTEVGPPDSFDPNDADKTQNIMAMRLLYSTPLMINSNNELTSSVFSEFNFDEKNNSAKFILKQGLLFSDGQKITTQDVAMSIARFGYFHPQFPVIKKIEGLIEWANRKKGLIHFPKGLYIDKNEIHIQFIGKMTNPLFRFCLEIFSIIPTSSIHLETGQLIDKLAPAPFSGFFKLQEKSAEQWIFAKRNNIEILNDTDIPYRKISLTFKNINSACELKLKKNDIIAGFEMDYIMSGCDTSSKSQSIKWLPASRFGLLRFNPTLDIFNSNEKRKYFSELVRKQLKKTYPNLQVERGLFSKLLPGYLSFSDLSTTNINLEKDFLNKEIILPNINEGPSSLIYTSIKKVAIELKMKIKMNDQNLNQKNIVDDFVTGKLSMIFGGSGFWAQDPIGDLEMYFTKNFHKTMTFTWADDGIYSRLESLDANTDDSKTKKLMEDFNTYIFEQSIVAPILHFRRFYKTADNQKLKELPQAVTSPSPWQLKLIDL